MKASASVLISLVLLACLSGCSRSDKATSQVTGAITYGEPITFEAGTVLELRLTDVSVSDGPALEVAKTTVPNLTALPYRYALAYDAAKIDSQHRYTIDARILGNGKPRFSTDTAYEVLTQGHGTERDMTVVATGANNPTLAQVPPNDANTAIFQNELRTGAQVSLYKAGLQDGHILWLEEDRSTGTPAPLHARYDFKGALITHYVDSSPLEITFDERGRPTSITKNNQTLKLNTQTDAINDVRNRAALLRSHALASSEARAHRQATGG